MATAKGTLVDNTAKYTSGMFMPIIENCNGCERIVEAEGTSYCMSYINPDAKWKLGICNFATHVKPEINMTTTKINPLKASKRAMGKKK
ncbi:MAG: PxxKW family cysteine-rich protein [Proteobacteria bacterium]|nr:PxxKW family cysteine-rich protein [Pseudomonadota bacterium]MBU1688865.1 PxxKW family cysteine-rich protein [Pseudomonadota bacterium]